MIVKTAISFLISSATTPLVIKIARKLKIVDKPDGMLKSHLKVTPYLGGLAIYAGVLPFLNDTKFLILASIMLIVGLIDDIKSISWYSRLGAELIVGWFMSLMISQDLLMNCFYTVLFVLIVNATNMIDGMDGVCATTVLIGMIFSGSFPIKWAVVGSLFGYLVYNFPPAKIFMGDAGSYFLGSVVAYAIFSDLKASFNLKTFFPFWILFLDILSGVVRRIIARRSPFKGDRDHIYDKIWRKMKGSKVTRDRKTVFTMGAMSCLFALFRYFPSPVLIAFVGSIVIVLFLKMFWYDEGGNKNE